MKPFFRLPTALSSVIVILSLLIYTSCDKSNPANLALPNAKETTQNFVDGDFEGQYSQSRVVVKGVKSNEIVVAVDGKGGVANQLYILQVKKDVKDVSNVSFDFNRAELLFFKNFLIINSLDNDKTLYFTINRSEGEEAFGKLPSNITGKINQTFNGFGLAQASGSWPVTLDFLKNATDTYEALDKYALNKSSQASGARLLAECASGGRGSTSCSLSGSTGCSVSCGAGTYACCNYVVSLQQNSGCKCR